MLYRADLFFFVSAADFAPFSPLRSQRMAGTGAGAFRVILRPSIDAVFVAT